MSGYCLRCGSRWHYDPAGVPMPCARCTPVGIATPAHSYSDKPAALTEERVREIVREELAKVKFSVTNVFNSVEAALAEGIARGAQAKVTR